MFKQLTLRLRDYLSIVRDSHAINSALSARCCVTRVPPEIWQHIFAFLYREPPDWTAKHYMLAAPRLPEYIRITYRDLRAVCLVCNAWRDGAIALVYARVHLPTAIHMEKLLRSLRTRPQLVSYIRNIRLPDETRELPPVSTLPRPLAPRPFASKKRRLWRIGCAVDTLLRQCIDVTDITFGSNTSNIVYIHGNSATAPRLTRLHILGDPRPARSSVVTLYTRMDLPRDLWPHTHMTQITLQSVHLHWTGNLSFPHLRSLHIHFCVPSVPGWMRNIVEHCPVLDTLHVENTLNDRYGRRWSADELRPARASLRELRLDWHFPIASDGFAFLDQLTLLEISMWCLIDYGRNSPLSVLPPRLQTLVLSSSHKLNSGVRSLLPYAAEIKKQLPKWKVHDSVGLTCVRLTADVDDGGVFFHTVSDWRILSFLLRPSCLALGVELEVSLFYIQYRSPSP
ncbi:hypothetical protein EXIGLDRAFT_733003 [Exidia glandulosa HHB12029]|uniref:F-box domain-containing protein n=1 Tax=Exidia glandulosa HHB12029 TaxID=1314781 RepID=A0A165KN56_EXIGL|nr:hypothetical protein EXIGLDRAFT_733003 [Exidia glandulosa HHB12029]